MRRMLHFFQEIGRFQRDARLYLLSNALSNLATGIFLVMYNLYLTSLGYNADFVGATLFVGTLGGGLAIFPAGYCIDRWSGKWILLGSNILIGLLGLGAILFRQPVPLLIISFLTGVVAAFVLVLNAPFLSRKSQPAERAQLFSLNIVLSQIAVVIGEVCGGALPTWFQAHPTWSSILPGWLLASQSEPRSYQLALLMAGVISLPGLLPLFWLSNDRPEPRASIGPLTEPRTNWKALLKIWRQPEHLRAFVVTPFFVLVLVQILTGLGAGLIIPYFNLFFVRHLKASPALFGLLDGAANGLMALTTLFGPWLAVRLGRVNSIALTRLSSLPVMLVLGFTGSLSLAALLYPLREGLMDMSQGVLQVFSMEEVPEERRGLANSAYQGSYQIAWAISSSLGGIIIVSSGYSPLFVSAAICYLATVVLLWTRFGTGKDEEIITGEIHERAPQESSVHL